MFGLEIVAGVAVAGAVAGGAAYYKKKKVEERKMKMLFKKSLFDLQKYHLVHADGDSGPMIPQAYINMLERIDPDGLKDLRVFRAQGNLDNIQKIRNDLNKSKAKKVSLKEEPVDDIACLLKIYLYQLPESLIPPTIAISLIDKISVKR